MLPLDTEHQRRLLHAMGGYDVSLMSDQEVSEQFRSKLLQTAKLIKRKLSRVEAKTTRPLQTIHPLVDEGVRFLHDKQRIYGNNFPSDIYADLARHLFEVALERLGRDYGAAFSLLNDLQNAQLGNELQNEYTRIVGTDSANGWDKFRHFVFTAYLQYKSCGVLAPELFTYGKEAWDEIERWFGQDPEGYSIPDIRADNKGERFGEEMAVRERRERWEAARREWEKFHKVFIEQDPEWIRWFLRRLR